MRVRGRIEDDPILFVIGAMKGIDQRSFMVRSKVLDALLGKGVFEAFYNIFEGGSPIMRWIPLSQKV